MNTDTKSKGVFETVCLVCHDVIGQCTEWTDKNVPQYWCEKCHHAGREFFRTYYVLFQEVDNAKA